MRIYADDFVFNGVRLSQFGMRLCSFESASLEKTSSGSSIEMNTSKPPLSHRWNYYSQEYDAPLKFTVQMTKANHKPISPTEQAAVSRWLIRKDGYKEFQFDSEDFIDILFHANATSLNNLCIAGNVVGMEASFICDAPFGYSRPVHKEFSQKSFQVNVNSDEIGYLYPVVTISVEEDGDLELKNLSDGNHITKIAGCTAGERIYLDNESKIITSSVETHNIPDCFNWKWVRLIRSDSVTKNRIEVSLSCHISMDITQIRKVGIE